MMVLVVNSVARIGTYLPGLPWFSALTCSVGMELRSQGTEGTDGGLPRHVCSLLG